MDTQLAPICLPIHLWPENDRAAWTANCQPNNSFDDDFYAASLRPDSVLATRKGYSRFLGFLASKGWLDETAAPLERVTLPRLRAYLRDLKFAGNTAKTIIGRFTQLTMALKILAPGCDVSWVSRPYGLTIYAMLDKIQRPLEVPDIAALHAWAFETMDNAEKAANHREKLIAYRDGLLLAMLASRARRLRSIAHLRLGTEFFLRRDRYWIDLAPGRVKTKKADSCNLPSELTPYVEHYLEVVRPALLGNKCHDALWVSTLGDPLSEKGFQSQVMQRAHKRFGYTFGPHRFRHAISTAVARYAPGHKGLAAKVMGISEDIVELNYNRVDQVEATHVFGAMLDRLRS